MPKIQNKPNPNKSFDVNDDLAVATEIANKTDLFYYNQSFYIFGKNYWKPIGHHVIKKKVLDILENKYKQGRVNNIVDIIQIQTRKDIDEINLNKKANALNVKNGIYYIDKDELIPHNEESKYFYSTNLININYNKKAESPRWNLFVNEIFAPDIDKYEKISLLQEFMGLCLTHNISFQKALVLLGSGSNGKSLVIEVIEAILGKENYSNIELHQLNNKFLVVELENKHANICSEIDHSSKFISGIFKRLITGDTLTGDVKFKDPKKFKSTCKLLFATNDLPRTNDTSNGYFRRLLILKFNRKFEGKEKDQNLINDLLSELDGIFNWMIEGLSRLYNNKRFTNTPSSNEEIYRYLETSNSVVSFITEMTEITPSAQPEQYVSYDELYQYYRRYCHDTENRPFKKTNFKIEIEKQYSGKILIKRHGDRGTHFQNLKYLGQNI